MIDELIKKYEEELKNCIEQEEVWKKEISNVYKVGDIE